MKSAEEQYREFRKSEQPCSLKVAPSARQPRVARHPGEGVEAMIHRLQGTKPSAFRPGLPTVRGLLKEGEGRAP